MGATLEKMFYEQLVDMPADVRNEFRFLNLITSVSLFFRKLKSYLIHQNHLHSKNIAEPNSVSSVVSPSATSEHINSPGMYRKFL